MKRDTPAPSCLLQVNPLGGRLPREIPIELNLAREELIKHEPVTLIWRTVLPDGRPAVVKMYRRGLLVTCRSLATVFRVQREFDGLSRLEKLGISCSIPLFWCHDCFGPYGWGEMLVTELVAQSQPLRNLLATGSEVGKSLDLSPLFADMAVMHAAGLHHGMLRTRNVLVKNYPEQPTFAIIDLARCHLFPQDIRGKRMARYDLMSLCEGLLPHFPENSAYLWLSAYGIPEPEKMDLVGRLKQFQSTSFLRKVLAWEFDVRNAMARPLKFFPPKNLGNQQH